MIKSINDCHSTGDALDFVTDNVEYFERIEKAISEILTYQTNSPYEFIALYFERKAKKR